ncbi:MAG TPA: MarR family transcriptional regulator [Terriglobales bacterium]|nr:MarR family transcriptional regulator [Terriglobales bacterium]
MARSVDNGRQERALGAYVKLLRASESVHGEAMRSLAKEDITPSQFAVLEALYHVGPMCLSVLADKILKTSGNLTMVVGNLEKRGLVTREQSTHDRRFVSAAITEKGKKLIARIFPEHATRITDLMNRLTPREQETLAELCLRLGKNSETAKARS